MDTLFVLACLAQVSTKTFISVVVDGLAKVCVGLLRIFADVLDSVCRAKIIKNSFIACLEGVKKWGMRTL